MRSSAAGLVHVGLATCVSAILLWGSDIDLAYRAIASAMGIAAGVLAGLHSARLIQERLDRRNGIVLYFQDSAAYGWLLPLGIVSLSPLGLESAMRGVARSENLQQYLQFALCGLGMMWLVHDLVIARRLREIESSRGPLHVQWFYARSVVGPEALIGETGVVTKRCQPTGYVRIKGELWKAQSLDGTELPVGRRVIVRRIHGLVLMVEPVVEARG